jgi:hypothetical protein
MSNMSLIVGSFGALPVLCIAVGITHAVGTTTTAQNTLVYSYLIAFFTAVWSESDAKSPCDRRETSNER